MRPSKIKEVLRSVLGKWLFTSVILFTLLFTGLAIVYDFDGYREVTGERFGIKYSFEYPASYVDNTHTIEYITSEGYALVFYAFRTTYIEYGNKIIIVSTREHDLQYPNATAKANELPINERDEIEVSGIRGIMVTYQTTDFHGYKNSIAREVYFDYNERIWNIRIEAPEELADEAESDFMHILDTFAIEEN